MDYREGLDVLCLFVFREEICTQNPLFLVQTSLTGDTSGIK